MSSLPPDILSIRFASNIGGLDGREEGRQTIHWRPVGFTITIEKIDRILADVQIQIETLRQNTISLRLVTGQLAATEATWRGK